MGTHATAVEPTTLLALEKHTFEALPQDMLGYLLSRDSIQCLAKLPNPGTT
jgi:hypothetical protein